MTTAYNTEMWREAATHFLEEARSLKVATAEDYDEAASLRAAIKRAYDSTEAERTSEKQPHLEAGRAVDAAYKPALESLTVATTTVDAAMRVYRQAEEARRKAAELKAREAAEKERLRLEKQAERAEARGLTDTADELSRAADSIETPVIASHVPKVDGLSARLTWKFEIKDPDAIPREYLVIDEQAIGRVVRALKSNARIPGVRVYSEESFASKRD